MKTERIALFVIDLAFALAEHVSDWLDKRARKKRLPRPTPSGLSLKDLLEIKKANDAAQKKSEAPTVVIPPPSEWGKLTPAGPKRGGGGSRY